MPRGSDAKTLADTEAQLVAQTADIIRRTEAAGLDYARVAARALELVNVLRARTYVVRAPNGDRVTSFRDRDQAERVARAMRGHHVTEE
jgi:hypothetical protein